MVAPPLAKVALAFGFPIFRPDLPGWWSDLHGPGLHDQSPDDGRLRNLPGDDRDDLSRALKFTFGIRILYDGLGIVVVMGLFGISEVLLNIRKA
jgi:hypothetical protein